MEPAAGEDDDYEILAFYWAVQLQPRAKGLLSKSFLEKAGD